MEKEFEEVIVVDELEEAKFIKEWLKEEAGVEIDLDTILLITEAQLAYMEKIGLIEEFKG